MKILCALLKVLFDLKLTNAHDIESTFSGCSAEADFVIGEYSTSHLLQSNLVKEKPVHSEVRFEAEHEFVHRLHLLLTNSTMECCISEVWDHFINYDFKLGLPIFVAANNYMETSTEPNKTTETLDYPFNHINTGTKDFFQQLNYGH
jgi:hypothetical protein